MISTYWPRAKLPHAHYAHIVSSGVLALLGSGETGPGMTKVHRGLLTHLDEVRAVNLNTPFGFQENVPQMTEKLLTYFSTSLHLDMAALVSQARVLVTDSGGLQKEAYWYGVPCVTARPSTEWIDTVELGANVLVDDDPEKLATAVASARMPDERPPLYGDGHAAERVAASLADRG